MIEVFKFDIFFNELSIITWYFRKVLFLQIRDLNVAKIEEDIGFYAGYVGGLIFNNIFLCVYLFIIR